jgi:hypothetical protein
MVHEPPVCNSASRTALAGGVEILAGGAAAGNWFHSSVEGGRFGGVSRESSGYGATTLQSRSQVDSGVVSEDCTFRGN